MTADAAEQYDADFYSMISQTSSRSASVVVPLVLDHVSSEVGIDVSSVLDLGCGAGDWLAELRRRGVEEIVGIDGAWATDAARRNIGDAFRPGDVGSVVDLGRRFDLAMSLEVAEHLDESAAATIVANLVRHSDVVVFSAAVPGQGGHDHVNEQWPSWWAARFAEHGYRPVDAIRPLIWSEPGVDFWYAQNLVIYRNDGPVPESLPPRFDAIHPTMWRVQRNQARSFRFLGTSFVDAARSRVDGVVSRLRR